MFSWIVSLIKALLRLIGLGRLFDQPPPVPAINIGDDPTLTSPPVATIPDSFRNAVRFALDSSSPTTVEIDLGTINNADLDPQKALTDVRLLKDFIANHPAKVQELVASATDLEKAQEILREVGLEREYQQGNLITGALTLARIESVGRNPRALRSGETPPTRGARKYLPLEPISCSCDKGDAVFIGMEGSGVASVLYRMELLVETEVEQGVCLADTEMVETAIVERAEQFGQIYANFHDDEQVKALVYELGLDEESTSNNGGGLGCLCLVALVVVVVLVCAAYVFSDKTAKSNFTSVDSHRNLELPKPKRLGSAHRSNGSGFPRCLWGRR